MIEIIESTMNENQEAVRREYESLAKKYPHGQYLAFVNGDIVYDSTSFHELRNTVHEMGYDKMLIYRVGDEILDGVDLFPRG